MAKTDPTTETTVEVRYKITVQRTAVEVTLRPREYGQVGQIEKARDATFRTDDKKTFIAAEYGMLPEILSRDVVTREIYSQTVPGLDLPALVSVVNGLGVK